MGVISKIEYIIAHISTHSSTIHHSNDDDDDDDDNNNNNNNNKIINLCRMVHADANTRTAIKKENNSEAFLW